MQVICYGCGRGEKPENTIEGIRHCQKINADWWIEMDLQVTKDGIVVLFHDDNTYRITGVSKKIKELDYKEILELNSGYNFKEGTNFPYREKPLQIPTLAIACKLFPAAKFVLDIHTDDISSITKIIAVVKENGMTKQVIIVSQYHHVIKEFKQNEPIWYYGASAMEVKNMVYSSFFFLDTFFPIQSDIVMLPVKYGKLKLLTNRVIRHIKKRNKKIWVWLLEGKQVLTITSKNELDQLKCKGVDGVFTEFPEKLHQELRDVN